MLDEAKARGFEPTCVAFDSWYSRLENLKAVRAHGWTVVTQLKVNRKLDLDRRGYRAVGELDITPGGTIVHLQGFGSIRVFKSSPETETLSTGRPMTRRWTIRPAWPTPSDAGGSRIIIGA